MAANGISTLSTKAERKTAKISLAEIRRGTPGPMYRSYNVYIGTVSPVPHRPWGQATTPPVDGGNAGTTLFTSFINGDGASAAITDVVDGGFAV